MNSSGFTFRRVKEEMIENLLEREIEPFLTLNHWDIPQIFLEKGGWANRDCIDYFLEYTNILSDEFGDVVKNWITHNEPWVISHLGYSLGTHAPGIKSFSDWKLFYKKLVYWELELVQAY